MDNEFDVNVEMNRGSLSEFLRRRYPDRLVVFESRPEFLDELAAELRLRGFNRINEVEQMLTRTETAARLFEKGNPPNADIGNNRYSAIGIVRISMLLLDDDFFTFKETILDDTDLRKRLAEYRRHILPEESAS